MAIEESEMCECRAKFDEKLAASNCRLASVFQVTKDNDLQLRYAVATEKIDKTKRKEMPTVIASFCPFCGERLYPPPQ
jgi:hypothetical protein